MMIVINVNVKVDNYTTFNIKNVNIKVWDATLNETYRGQRRMERRRANGAITKRYMVITTIISRYSLMIMSKR